MECVAKKNSGITPRQNIIKGKHKFLLGALLVHAKVLVYRQVLPPLCFAGGLPGCIWIAADRAGNCLEQIHEKTEREGDLWPWFLLLDIWLFLFLAFCSCLMEKPAKTWN